jgi:oxygen-independent coproporphyrinogen-3 oxidase
MVDALYIHIPYCKQKCLYCDFNSFADRDWDDKNYVAALKEEILLKAEGIGPHKIESIFFGGGTPTILPAAQIKDILGFCYKKFSIPSDCEISIEANPDTVDYVYLRALRQGGFNRLSFGCQSFNDNLLRKIGRKHSSLENRQKFFAAKKAGFDNISLDLMFGLPEQNINLWQETLQSAAQLKPTHFSLYNLTIEPNTPFQQKFHQGELDLPTAEIQLAMYEMAMEYLPSKNYRHYEISNFALEGYECRHNKGYWQNKDYLGIGPGAASYLNGFRSKNILSPHKYILNLLSKGEIGCCENEMLNLKGKMGETLILGLRLLDGISYEVFEKRFGKTLDAEFGDKIKKLQEEQLLENDGKKLKLTHKGIIFSNEVFVELV